ncbi:MAG: aldehyde dehydrogenase, partial [Coriobacteriales bacterium]
AVDAAYEAQQDLINNYSMEDREKFIQAIRAKVFPMIQDLCQMEFDETGYGRVEDKLGKNTGALMATPGTEAIPTNMYASKKGLTVEYYVPYGVIGAITPVTNPIATPFGNGICAMAGGNTVIFNAHPNAVKTTSYAIQLFNQAVVEAGGPNNILVAPKVPTMGTLDEIMNNPKVKLLVGTGGPAMVKTLMSSGKKVVAAGPGNPPSIVDETADIKKCAAGLLASASFDNNLLCIAEKEVFVVDAVFDELVQEFKNLGCYVATREEADRLTDVCLVKLDNGGYAANKKWVGKMAKDIAAEAGIKVDGDPRLVIFEAQHDEPLVQTEQMMPVLPFVRCKDFDQAVEWAVPTEHGNWHSASIWTEYTRRATKFGRLINTTIFVQNGGTMSAFGDENGSGTNSPTIATPTGEGVTGPQTFLRRRRICFADGENYMGA